MAATTVRNDALTPSADLAGMGTGQGNGGQGSQGSRGRQTAQGGDNNGNQGDGCHSCGGHSGEDGNSGEHGHHGGQPVPSFWNFIENEHGHEGFGGRGHNQFELMWHHA